MSDKEKRYIIRPSHYGAWITESPRGVTELHRTKKDAEIHARKKGATFIDYQLPKQNGVQS